MVEAGGTIELLEERRKIDRHSPLLRSPAHTRGTLCQARPTTVQSPRAIGSITSTRPPCAAVSSSRSLDPGSGLVRQLVEDVGGDDAVTAARRHGLGDIALARTSVNTELLIRPLRFFDGPRVAIDADDRRSGGDASAHAAPAAPVPHPRSTMAFGDGAFPPRARTTSVTAMKCSGA